MKRSNKARAEVDEDNGVEAKKSNITEQEEIEWAPEGPEINSDAKQKRQIRIVKSNVPTAQNGYGYKPRLIPPWTSRIRANRYVSLNVDNDGLYIARDDDEAVEETAYTITNTEVPVVAEAAAMEIVEPIAKADMEAEEEQEIVVDDINEEQKEEIKPRRSVRARKPRRRSDDETVESYDPSTSADVHVITQEELYTYEVVDGDVTDTVVVDDDGQATEQYEDGMKYDIYQQPYHEEVNSLFVLGNEISKHPWQSNEEVNHFFITNPTLNCPIDVRELATMAKTATPDLNYQLIVGLAGLVNSMKREMNVLKVEVNSLRDMVASKQDLGNTKRHFATSNVIRHSWRIQAQPPLREVDLNNTARNIDITRGTKKPLTNKEGITRFVKTVLELLIPEEQARYYTVRERTHRKNGLKDIGDHTKEQIVGCVLDILGLYDIDELDEQGRADRNMFTTIVNQAMRTSLIDLRRSEPRRRIGDSDYAQLVE